MLTDKKIKLIIRLGGLIIFIAMLFVFVLLDINFSGHKTISIDKGKTNAQFSTLFPVDRTIVDNSWQIIDEPVYFTTRMSAPYDSVQVKVKYRNDCCQEVLLGLQAGDGWSYEQELLDNTDFNNLNWHQTSMEEISVWSKDETIVAEDKLIESLADNDNIAKYNVNNVDFKIEDYTDYRKAETLNVNLVGDYTMLVYVDSNLDMQFNFNELNKVNINIYDSHGNLIQTDEVEDSSYLIELDNLVSGLYKVNILTKATTNSIISTNRYINFINQLSLASNNYSLVSNASTIRIKAVDYPGLQIINYADKELDINKLNKKYYLTDLDQLTYLNIPKGGIQIYSDGLFSFNDEYLLDSIPGKVKRIKDDSDYDFLVAKYNTPIIDNEWSVNDISFDLSNATISNGKLRFMIGALGATIDNPLIIESIKVTYDKKTGQSLWSEFIAYLKYWWRNR
ncbi:MAG: hypothetical protein ACKKL6_02155 [Candidatus Komeilibacteria bacterium]